jgi:class 3 adenylate cyclase
MDEQDQNVIHFPVHRRGTLADTLGGFPTRDGGPTWSASRREHSVSLVLADLRGHGSLAARLGGPAADDAVRGALAAAIASLRSHGGERLAVGGGDSQPVVCAEFSHPDHALQSILAGNDLRDAVHAATDGIEACVGVNTGTVVEATLPGNVPMTYRAMATVRMFAVRLQEFAGPGQVFVSASTVARIDHRLARLRSIGEVRTNAGGETTEAFALLELSAAARALRPAPGSPGGHDSASKAGGAHGPARGAGGA